jgi:hypothetical protein
MLHSSAEERGLWPTVRVTIRSFSSSLHQENMRRDRCPIMIRRPPIMSTRVLLFLPAGLLDSTGLGREEESTSVRVWKLLLFSDRRLQLLSASRRHTQTGRGRAAAAHVSGHGNGESGEGNAQQLTRRPRQTQGRPRQGEATKPKHQTPLSTSPSPSPQTFPPPPPLSPPACSALPRAKKERRGGIAALRIGGGGGGHDDAAGGAAGGGRREGDGGVGVGGRRARLAGGAAGHPLLSRLRRAPGLAAQRDQHVLHRLPRHARRILLLLPLPPPRVPPGHPGANTISSHFFSFSDSIGNEKLAS